VRKKWISFQIGMEKKVFMVQRENDIAAIGQTSHQLLVN